MAYNGVRSGMGKKFQNAIKNAEIEKEVDARLNVLIKERGGTEELTYKNSRILSRGEITQKAFEVLFQKYGGDGLRAAELAIMEVYPHIKNRKKIIERARLHMINTPYAMNMSAALEAQGVTANEVAIKIKELINAKHIRKQVWTQEDGVTKWTETDEIDAFAVDKGITQALKVGLGGGYAPEKSLIKGNFSLSKLLEEVEKAETIKTIAPAADGE